MNVAIQVKKCLIVIVCSFLFFVAPLEVYAQIPTNTLRVQGSQLISPNGSRFVVEGVNIEFYRDSGCSYVTEQGWAQRTAIVAKMKSLGINAVRFNYYASWLSQGSNITQFLDFLQLFAQNGIYVMPSDHSFTGKTLTNYSSVSYPMFQAIVNGARARGIEQYLIFNPYNEPYGQDESTNTWANWINTNKDTVNYFRNTLNFKNLIILDTRSWAAAFDVPSLQQLMTYDATLLSGTSNVAFSNHWYPNIGISNVTASVNASNQVPLVIGELGQYNATPDNPQYVKDVFSSVINTGIPKGHNGIFPWMWNWCDSNSMTASWNDHVNLSTFGQLVVDNYYSKISGGTAPTPINTVSPSVTPRPISTSSPTPRPISTLSPTPRPITTQSPSIMPTTLPTKPGDANGDGKVDGIDYVIWLGHFGQTTSRKAADGDFNADNIVNGIDYVIWLNSFSKTSTYQKQLTTSSDSDNRIKLSEIKAPVLPKVYVSVQVDPSVTINYIDWYINGGWNSHDDGSKFLGGKNADGTPKGFTLPSNPTTIRAVVYTGASGNYIEAKVNYSY